MIFTYEILGIKLGMIGHYAALADPLGVSRAHYWRIRKTILV